MRWGSRCGSSSRRVSEFRSGRKDFVCELDRDRATETPSRSELSGLRQHQDEDRDPRRPCAVAGGERDGVAYTAAQVVARRVALRGETLREFPCPAIAAAAAPGETRARPPTDEAPRARAR